jgi:hypothetical protein
VLIQLFLAAELEDLAAMSHPDENEIETTQRPF